MLSLSIFLSIWNTFTPKRKSKSCRIIALGTIATFFELVGIGMLIPVISVVINGGAGTEESAFFDFLNKKFGVSSVTEALIIALSMMLALALIKVTVLTIYAKRISGFIFGLQAEITNRMFRSYLLKDYIFHARNNSSDLIRNIFEEVALCVGTVFKTILTMIADLVLMFAYIVLALVFLPTSVLAIGAVFLGAAFMVNSFLRRKVEPFSEKRHNAAGERLRRLQEALNGIKELKVFGQEHSATHQFNAVNREYATAGQNYSYISSLPGLWLEFIGTVGIFFTIAFMALSGYENHAIASTLGVLIIALFRCMPAASRLVSGMQAVAYGKPAVEKVCDACKSDEEYDSKTVDRNTEFVCKQIEDKIELKNVSYTYPGTDREVLSGINIEIKKGEIIGIMGPSGSGKTTLIDLILGLLTPASGKIYCDGICNDDIKDWRAQFSYVPQRVFLLDDTIENNITFSFEVKSSIDSDRMSAALKGAGLEEFIGKLPNGLSESVGEIGSKISGGELQRIGIARVLYRDSPIIVFDESTSALDPETEASVMKSIAELRGEKTILIVSHKKTPLQYCDRVIHLEEVGIKLEHAFREN
ncbi:MAG: hypothetical protein CMO74_13010 [Verrucomicrobiales bacterium]|nr:hypothetical protein [Verrucomicrobiales bacterium]|tara:strand:+ start:5969 stop:7732 length:1764 start_codon:yes stop_codon:yes gene_type:complete